VFADIHIAMSHCRNIEDVRVMILEMASHWEMRESDRLCL